MAVVFDAKGKTFRDDIYPEYKATRASMPDDLRQVAPIHQMIKAMGFPSRWWKGWRPTTSSAPPPGDRETAAGAHQHGDKDMAQLVSDHVTLIDTMKDVKNRSGRVIEKFGAARGTTRP